LLFLDGSILIGFALILYFSFYNIRSDVAVPTKKSLIIPKGKSAAVNQRRTDNTMAKQNKKDKQRSTKRYIEN